MAYSYTLQAGNGATTVFNFSFPYIAAAHISVLVNGVSTAFSFLTSSSLSVTPAPALGAVVKIQRVTPKATAPFDFADGSVLKETDLDTFALYTLYWAQEAQDAVDGSITQNAIGQWNGQDRIATNFADPVNDSDLVTKGYIDENFTSDLNAQVAIATTQAGISTTQAGISTTQATSAAASAVSAAASAASTASLLDSFDDRYLGPYAANPTLDNDGNALQIGALYTNTVANEMRVYTSSGWISASSSSVAALVAYKYVATAGQTVFTGTDVNGLTLSYIPGGVILALNGSVLDPVDYVGTNGTSITLASAAALNEELLIVAFSSFSVANTYTQAQVNALFLSNTYTQVQIDAKDADVVRSIVPVRQTVLSGPVDTSGYPAFGGSTGGTTVTATGTLKATAAAGGDANYSGSATNPAWTGLSTNGTMYLYLAITSGGVVTTGSTTLAPIYQWGGTPSVVSGQHTYNIQEGKMYVGNGSAASQVYRVFAGRVTVAGGVVTAITWYALMGRYDSGYTNSIPGASTTVSKNHNLGVEPYQKTIEIKNLITEQGWSVGDVGTPVTNGGAISPFSLASTDIVISFITGNTNSFYLQNRTTGTFQPLTSSNWAYRVTANRGW